MPRDLPELIEGSKGERVSLFATSLKDYYAYPVDIQILNPEATVIMHQPDSKFPHNNRAQGYLTLLAYALEEKPSLESDDPSLRQQLMEVSNTFRAPGAGYQNYTPIEIDATSFEQGGTLIIDIEVGEGEATGSFDLYDADVELPTEGFPNDALASVWDIPPRVTGQMIYRFPHGQQFKLGATGNWFCEKGSTNTFIVRVSVVPAETREASS
ncbi:MAG: hypothetical protein OXN27_06500 [Candidatus Poribacteria bacterium]|nr:hypothetical protein [Candidatus Poribacteria bacterium]MDE0323558.1 hypothetical protein [Candidatus Poribacteria bacterium]